MLHWLPHSVGGQRGSVSWEDGSERVRLTLEGARKRYMKTNSKVCKSLKRKKSDEQHLMVFWKLNFCVKGNQTRALGSCITQSDALNTEQTNMNKPVVFSIRLKCTKPIIYSLKGATADVTLFALLTCSVLSLKLSLAVASPQIVIMKSAEPSCLRDVSLVAC